MTIEDIWNINAFKYNMSIKLTKFYKGRYEISLSPYPLISLQMISSLLFHEFDKIIHLRWPAAIVFKVTPVTFC